MNEAAGPPTPRRRPPPAAVTGLVVAALVACALWWLSAGQGAGGLPPEGQDGPGRLTVQAGVGGSIVGHWVVARSAPPPASYQVRVVTADGGATVATATTWAPSVVVPALAVGGRYQLIVTPTGPGRPATSMPVTVLPDGRPGPPLQVTIGQLAGTNGLRVAWTPDPAGVAASGTVVQLFDGATYRGYVRCQADCTTAAFRGLPYGRRYSVHVIPVNNAGEGPAAASNPVDLGSPCPAVAACVNVDATVEVGPARQRAQGFLNSLYPIGDMVARLRALHPNSWRGSPIYLPATGAFDWTAWDAAVATGASTTMLLSNLWHGETTAGSGARPPWADWGAYATWVTTTVRAIEASGHKVSYWEIQNEPGAPTYLGAGDWAASTVAEYLQQFLVAYQAIKAADPDARILGPSLSHFADYPGEYDAHEPDLVTFLDFAARHDLRFFAISWHEIDNDLGAQPRDFNRLPQMIEDHVAEGRRLIADRPALGHPQVWVNEYGRQSDYALPGSTVGDIAALEGASVDRAGRSCWPEPNANGTVTDDCAGPTLDGLLVGDGSTPRANYWVYATYARMTGTVVATASSDATVSVLATRDDSSGRLVAMVGRHVSCQPGINLSCTGPDAVAVPPVAVSIAVRVPWLVGAAPVTITQVPATWAAVVVPPTALQASLPVVEGRMTLALPAVADGEAYLITIGH